MTTSHEHIQPNDPIIEHVAYGGDTGIDPLVFDGAEHVPYVTKMSNRKVHVYFTPGGLLASSRADETLKQRALSKIDPRITYRRNGDHSTFHGFLITPDYLGGKFSQPAFDWLMGYCEQTGAPITNTTSINKPTIALFLQKQNAKYGFQPDSKDAIAEIFPPERPGEFTIIRWLYNTLPPEKRIRQVKQHTFYEVYGDNGIISKRRQPLNPKHHIVALHTTYSRH